MKREGEEKRRGEEGVMQEEKGKEKREEEGNTEVEEERDRETERRKRAKSPPHQLIFCVLTFPLSEKVLSSLNKLFLLTIVVS